MKGESKKSVHSKSRSLTPLPKDKRSISPSPIGNGRSVSRSPVLRSRSPDSHRAERSPAPREARREPSRSMSRSPANELEKDSPVKESSPPVVTERSPTPEDD